MKTATLILATLAAAVFAVVFATNLMPVFRQAAHESMWDGAYLALFYLLIPAFLLFLAVVLPMRLVKKDRRAWALIAAIVLFILATPVALFELFLVYG
ncbi:MAG TPA: hypothetical protein VGI89_00165 [Rhizomicrobium sp.]|jgi:hypothetical protein